jgi:hypothetical protein
MLEVSKLRESYAITSTQIEELERRGFLILRQVFSVEEREKYFPILRDYVINVQAAGKTQDAVPFGNPAGPPSSDASAVAIGAAGERAGKTAFNLEDAPPDVVDFITSSRLGEIAARLLAVQGVRLMHFSGLFKPPGSPGTPLHQDLSYLPLDTDRELTAWIPLMDITADKGALIFAEGSHQLGEVEDPMSVPRDKFSFKQTGTMHAGDISLHLGWTIHGSLKNATSHVREAFGISYYADGSRIQLHGKARFMKTLLESSFAGLSPGDLAAGPKNPVIFPV